MTLMWPRRVAGAAQRVARAVATRRVVPRHARSAHPARTIATFACALAILAPHKLSVPRADTSSPAGTSVASAAETQSNHTVVTPSYRVAKNRSIGASSATSTSADDTPSSERALREIASYNTPFHETPESQSHTTAMRSIEPTWNAFASIDGKPSDEMPSTLSCSRTATRVVARDSCTEDVRRPGGGATVGDGACSFERSAGGARARNARVAVSHGWETAGVPGTHRCAAPRPARKLAREVTKTPNDFAIAKAPYKFKFPQDHAAHPDYQSEWWYYTGHVRTKQGRRFGYELTFFRIGLRPGDPQPTATQSKWRGNQLYPAHFALTDEQGKTFYHIDRFAREALGMGHASSTALDVKADDWWLRGVAGSQADRERMTMHAAAIAPQGRDAIDFVQIPEKKPAIHGAGGVSRKAACASCASHYYSYTRLATRGTLVFDGQPFTVDGISWMDHEFGSAELQRDQAGWDWFSVQLDDGRELMLYLLRQKDGGVTPQSSGSVIERDGSVRHLERNDFAIEATGRWKSPHTAGVYPSGWRVRVAKAGVDLVLAPTVLDQELAGTSGGGISYWEGAVDVRDAAGRTLGAGYVELTGYAGALSI